MLTRKALDKAPAQRAISVSSASSKSYRVGRLSPFRARHLNAYRWARLAFKRLDNLRFIKALVPGLTAALSA